LGHKIRKKADPRIGPHRGERTHLGLLSRGPIEKKSIVGDQERIRRNRKGSPAYKSGRGGEARKKGWTYYRR